MSERFKLTRIPSLKTVEDFRKHCATLGIELPCEDAIEAGAGSPLVQAVRDNAGLVDWLLACPEKGWFQPIPPESSTAA